MGSNDHPINAIQYQYEYLFLINDLLDCIEIMGIKNVTHFQNLLLTDRLAVEQKADIFLPQAELRLHIVTEAYCS